MRAKTTTKVGAVFFMAVLALAGTGMAYAWWHEDLVIDGDIYTGNFDTEFSLPAWPPGIWGDNEPGTDIWHRVLSPVDLTKDVADVTNMEFVNLNTISITIGNAYPGYEAWVFFGWVCKGTVPAHVRDVTYEAYNEAGELVDDVQLLIVPHDSPIQYPPITEAQLHGPAGEWFGWIHIFILEDDYAQPPILPQQDHTYTFLVTIHTIQYNYPGP